MLLNFLKTLKNEEGQDLLEYALLVALIALVAVGAVTAAGREASTRSSTRSPPPSNDQVARRARVAVHVGARARLGSDR